MSKTICLAWMLLLPFSAYAQTPSKPSPLLDQQVRAEIQKFKGKVTLFAKNLDTGASYGLGEDERVRTASTIKVPIMAATFSLVAEGKVKWSDELMLTKEKKVSGAGILPDFGEGLRLTLRDAVHLMIMLSDNTATNLVLDHITAEAVNERLEKWGFKVTRCLRKIGGGGESKAFSEPWNKKPDGSSSRYGIGVSTPREMVQLLEKIERGELVSSEAGKEMIAILKRQQYHDGIARNVKGIETATKPGALDALRSNIGIFYTKRGRIAMAITCDDMPEIDWSVDNPGYLLMSRLALLSLDELSR
jgi:beta-lactamase class A